MRVRHFAPWTALVGVVGCATVSVTVVPNPIAHGAVPANLVPQIDSARASYFLLPDALLVDEATITSVDSKVICFAVTLRDADERSDDDQPPAWRIYLRGDPSFGDAQPLLGPPLAPTWVDYPGSVPSSDSRRPATIMVVTENLSMCFAHHGAVNADTREVTLHVDSDSDMLRRIAFRWEFTP